MKSISLVQDFTICTVKYAMQFPHSVGTIWANACNNYHLIYFFTIYQEELREVFEGSCALIPIKIVADECKKLVDEFIPELIETLSSEMNPDTVCSVAGLFKNYSVLNLNSPFL